MKKIGSLTLLIFLGIIVIVCVKKNIDTEKNYQANNVKIEDDTMKWSKITLMIKDILGCNERTAQSLEQLFTQAGIQDIKTIEKEDDDIYRILKITTSESVNYYAYLSKGFFLEEIRKGSREGERIYFAIE